jgi:transposase
MGITHCKLKKSIQRNLLDYFVLEVTARSAADLLGLQPNTAILFYRKIRQEIAVHLAREAEEIFEGNVELDESYFGGVRKGKRGRGAAGKVAVFGILNLLSINQGRMICHLQLLLLIWAMQPGYVEFFRVNLQILMLQEIEVKSIVITMFIWMYICNPNIAIS